MSSEPPKDAVYKVQARMFTVIKYYTNAEVLEETKQKKLSRLGKTDKH